MYSSLYPSIHDTFSLPSRMSRSACRKSLQGQEKIVRHCLVDGHQNYRPEMPPKAANANGSNSTVAANGAPKRKRTRTRRRRPAGGKAKASSDSSDESSGDEDEEKVSSSKAESASSDANTDSSTAKSLYFALGETEGQESRIFGLVVWLEQ